jgi:hypothetical protein
MSASTLSSMSPIKISLISAVAAVAITGTALFLLQRARTEEFRQLRRANEQMRKDAYARWQSAHAASGISGASPGTVAAENAATVDSDQKGRRAGNADTAVSDAAPAYRFQGQATPVDALQSFAWACDRGDTALMQKLITFEGSARPKVEAYFATLPAEIRAQCPTIEALAAMLLVQDGMQRPFPRTDLLARATVEKISDDQVRTRLPGTPRDGGLFQRFGADWKFVITEAAVDGYLAKAVRR